MSKIIDTLTQASIDSGALSGVILGKFHFSPILRYTNAYQSIYWDEGLPSPEAGELEYQGLGHLASISVLSESQELSAQTIQLSISGIPNTSITDIFSDEYIGQPCYLWYATLDKETYAVEGGSSGPVLIFAGRMDFGNVEFGQTATITLNATSRLADWERPRGGRFNQGYQQVHVDPTDLGFDYIAGIQNKPISWGGITVSDPGQGDGTVGDDEMCFDKGTKFIMADGTYKEVQDIKVGDNMFKGGLVTQELKGMGSTQDWYSYQGVKVTGSHLVLEDGVWDLVKNTKKAIAISSLPYTYSICNVNNVMVSENFCIFSDYEVFPASEWEDRDTVTGRNYLNSRPEFNRELIKLKT